MMDEPKYKIGDRVYYLTSFELFKRDLITEIKAETVVREAEEYISVIYKTKNHNHYHIQERAIFPSKEALLNHIKQQLEELE